ncbi:hypothetical protein GH733_002499 [Mirounga leonina]|nr:hypothetical protein GH733_002499 [Mirounga leonina]
METGRGREGLSAESGSYAFRGATWTPTSHLAGIRSPSESAWLSSLTYSEAFHYGFGGRARRPLPEPQLLSLRPTSLRSQDISHLLTGLFRNLYTNEVIGEDLSANLIKARGSEDARHEEFVDELQRVRRPRSPARSLPLLSGDAVASRPRTVRGVPGRAPRKAGPRRTQPLDKCQHLPGVSVPGCSKLTFGCEKRSVPKKHLTKKLEASCQKTLIKSQDELDYTVDSLTGDLCSKAKRKAVKVVSLGLMSLGHVHCYLKELPLTFGQMVISLQNTTATSRYLRVLPPSTPYFALGLGMFPGKGGMVAPGMTCQYIVQFFPDCLGDFDDFILVETQSAHPLLIPLQARRPPPVLTLSPVLDCGYCLIGGMKVTRFICKNVGFSVGKFCIMPKKSWPPPSFRAVATIGFIEQHPFGILPSVFELAPGQAICVEVLFLPTSLEKAEQTFIIVCDNCQIKELVTVGIGQLVALDLIYISGEESQPEPGELTDLTAQHFIRFEPENLQSTARKQLIIRNATHVELAFHWQIMKPNLQPLMPGETYSLDSLKYHPDRETAFSILPERGVLSPHTDHEFILSFSPHEPRDFHSVLQMVLEDVPEPMNLEQENLKDFSYSVDDVIVLDIEVKGSVEPFQVLLEPYALIIPGENYIGINVKKNFKMWNNSKSPIRYLWGKISDCHIIEVEPCMGTIEPSEVEDFELSFTGGVPGPTSQDLLCEIQNSPSPVVLHIEAAFKGPALVINVSALQFGLLRLGQKATDSIQIQNVSQLPATWCMKESLVCLQERREGVSPFDIEPSSGQIHPLGECRVNITLEAKQCQRLQTVLELEVLLGRQASVCTARASPRRGTLGPSEERHISLELATHTQDELSDLALPCTVSGMKEPLVLGISGKPQGLQVAIAISMEGSDSRGLSGRGQGWPVTSCPGPGRGSVPSTELWPGRLEELRLDFGSKVPLRTHVSCPLILTNRSPIQTPFTLKFEYFGSPQDSLNQKPSVPDMPPALLKTSRIREHLARREQLNFMESMLSHGKGAAFFPHISQGMLGAHQQLSIDISGYANMWGEYWDNLICTVGDLPPTVIPVHMAVVGCPISSRRTTYYTTDPLQKEPVVRFGTQVSGGDTVTRVLRLNNSSPCDIRLDWETYTPEDREDRLVELLVYYGPPFPLRDQAGNDFSCPETPERSSSFWSPSPSGASDSSHEAAQAAEDRCGVSNRARQKLISVLLREHDGVPADHLYSISPKQVVVPAGGSSTISISFSPTGLGAGIPHKMACLGYALGFMSLDEEVERELPGRRRRLQDFAVGPLRLDLCSYVRPAQLSVELDYGGGVEFRHQASDLIPEQPCTGVLSELLSTHHLKLSNTTEIPQYFRLLVSRPFSVAQGGASRSRSAPGPEPGCEEEQATGGKRLVLHPQENMLVNVSFSLSLELLSYQKLPADQMLPGVDIRQRASGEKEMVFTQNLLLEYANQTAQVVPLRATVAVPELQLSTSWVDFGTCFVNQGQVREVDLMNLSGCRSYWAVLTGQQEPDKDPAAFRVSPNSGLLEARLVNAPPNSITLQVFFTARSSELYESTLVVEGVLGEKACTLRLRGRGSYDEKYVSPHQL